MAKDKALMIGLTAINAKLDKVIAQVPGKTMKGLIEASIVIRRSMEKQRPLTPVMFGNLRLSWRTSPQYDGKRPIIWLSYTAEYAAWVHEMENATFSRPGAGANWFEEALERNQKKILETIAKNAKV